MTANDTNDNDREKDTDPGSPERRLGEVVKQTEIVLDQLESEQRADLEARVEELEAGILKLISENVRGNYRNLTLDAWHSLADALEEGRNPEPALWAWLFKCQEAMDLTVGDFDRAGFVERESPRYLIAYESFDLARCAWATAGTPDDREGLFDVPDSEQGALEETTQIYRRIGQWLGEIRVDVLGEPGDAQSYHEIDLEPGFSTVHSGDFGGDLQPSDIESVTVGGDLVGDSPGLALTAEGDDLEVSVGADLDPDTCRELAMQLLNMAADAEHSGEVDA